MKIEQIISKHLKDSIRTKESVLEKNLPNIIKAAQALIETYWKNGGTVYLFGNGGSSCDAQHFAEELTSAFRTLERWSLPAHALSDNGAVLTAIGNDYGFEYIFARQLEGVAKKGDLVIAFSTSGNSVNILRALEVAKKRDVKTVGFLGKKGGKAASVVDIPIVIPSDSTDHIQECHITIAHALCTIIEELFFDSHDQ
jgi:D-sedoheptulose 7-phosphate isomerase